MEKEHILGEIRRTTAANGGVPPGSKAFYRLTGITQSDWFGKFWARWGDAVREAGFSPNLKNTAFAEDFLLGKYIELTRELGHFPVRGELRMKCRQHKDFPSSNVFDRLGRKLQIIQRVRQYAESRPGHEDVLALCAEADLSVGPVQTRGSAGNDSRPEQNGFVYLVKSGAFYKIGKSNSAGRRAYELAIQLPEPVRPVHEIATDDPAGIESYWHRRFEPQRRNGEWFELTSEQVKAFKRRKYM